MLVSVLIFILLLTPAYAIRQPVGIAGIVYLGDQPLPNAQLIITNTDTNETDDAITDSNGLYTASLSADNGEKLRIVALMFSGENETTVNLSRPTQWLNLSLNSTSSSLFKQPVGIAGSVYHNFSAVPSASVYITNIQTGETTITTTNNQGLYASSVGADNMDIIKIAVITPEFVGSNIIKVDLSKPTQWANISIGSILANFKIEPAFPKVGEPIQFRDKTVGHPLFWTWSFGDGSSSSQQNPTHTYEKSGTYTVTLTTSNSAKETSTTAGIVRVVGVLSNPYIPTPKKPLFPQGYSIKQMCDLLKITNTSFSTGMITVVYIDTGVTDRIFNVGGYALDLNKIEKKKVSPIRSTEDRYGHGTAVGSILLYILNTKIRNYRLVSIKAFNDKGTTSPELFVSALKLAKMLKPDIISISAGAIPVSNDVLSREASELTRAGIIVVASAGNSGPDLNTILSPANNPGVIAVGAEDPQKAILDLRDDTVCKWSSRGSPTVRKPDVVAPGESIRLPWGKTQEKVMSGTSFSAPFIAGGIAIAISENRGLYDITKTLYFWDGTIVTNAVKESLQETCYPKGIYYEWGSGIAQFDKMSSTLSAKLSFLIFAYVSIFLVIGIGIILAFGWFWQSRKRWWK